MVRFVVLPFRVLSSDFEFAREKKAPRFWRPAITVGIAGWMIFLFRVFLCFPAEGKIVMTGFWG